MELEDSIVSNAVVAFQQEVSSQSNFVHRTQKCWLHLMTRLILESCQWIGSKPLGIQWMVNRPLSVRSIWTQKRSLSAATSTAQRKRHPGQSTPETRPSSPIFPSWNGRYGSFNCYSIIFLDDKCWLQSWDLSNLWRLLVCPCAKWHRTMPSILATTNGVFSFLNKQLQSPTAS